MPSTTATARPRRPYAMYTVEVTNGAITLDLLIVAVGATAALIQAEEVATLATGEAYHYTGKFALATMH